LGCCAILRKEEAARLSADAQPPDDVSQLHLAGSEDRSGSTLTRTLAAAQGRSSMRSSSRRAARRARRWESVNDTTAVGRVFAESGAGVRWIVCVVGLLFFPAAFAGSLWLVPAAATIGSVAFLWSERRQVPWKEVAFLLTVLLAYFALSVVPCWTGSGFCVAWIVEQEAYLLGVGLLLFVAGYAAAGGAGRAYAYVFGTALVLFVAIGLVVFVTRKDLTGGIEPPFVPLLIERNDLASLVAWMFFAFGLFQALTRSTLLRFLAGATVLTIAILMSLATQSRILAGVAILGALFFVRIERRGARQWAVLAVAVTIFLAVEFRSVQMLVERALLATGGDSVSTRFFLWKSGWEMFLAAPWTGHGLGGFAGMVETYVRPEAGAALDVRFIPWPHNVLIEVLVEKGIVGLAAFLALLAPAIPILLQEPRVEFKDARRAAGYLLLTTLIIGLLDSSTKRLWFFPSILFALGMLEGLPRTRIAAPNKGEERGAMPPENKSAIQ
jgi:O-antigen ligase